MAGGKQQAAKSTTKLAAGMASLSRSEAAGEQQAAFPVHRQSAEGISLEHEGVGKQQAVRIATEQAAGAANQQITPQGAAGDAQQHPCLKAGQQRAAIPASAVRSALAAGHHHEAQEQTCLLGSQSDINPHNNTGARQARRSKDDHSGQGQSAKDCYTSSLKDSADLHDDDDDDDDDHNDVSLPGTPGRIPPPLASQLSRLLHRTVLGLSEGPHHEEIKCAASTAKLAGG